MPPKKKKQESDEVLERFSARFTFDNDSMYEGEFIKSAEGPIRSGHGKFICPLFEYNGEWNNDVIEGVGEVSFHTGAKYNGQFVNNKFHGDGEYVWPASDEHRLCIRFVGQFSYNEMLTGSFYDQEGFIYQGKVDEMLLTLE
ncbi:hypothetical protein PCE1_000402 [Barthelona sp. PCE]